MQTSFNTNIPQAIPSKPVSHSLLYSPIQSPSWAFPLSTICITINIIIIINLAAVTKFCSCTARYHPKPHQPSSIQPAIESARAGRHSLSLSWLVSPSQTTTPLAGAEQQQQEGMSPLNGIIYVRVIKVYLL